MHIPPTNPQQQFGAGGAAMQPQGSNVGIGGAGFPLHENKDKKLFAMNSLPMQQQQHHPHANRIPPANQPPQTAIQSANLMMQPP